ncbi:MAG: hypothetical protein IKN71_07930 [Alphaproteobacteria bacterium]|nr:hypothetical protein [Alphaproteobacteria bacterium]
MIIEEKSFLIKKIKKADGYWLLFPKGKKEPIKLEEHIVYGNLPPTWKFPWESHKLTLKIVLGKFICYAEMDGLVLFDFDESEYPEDIKKEKARIWLLERQIAAEKEKYIKSIKQQIVEYLPLVPVVENYEDNIETLPICWQWYMRMLVPMLYQDDEARRRLYLTYWLITIANRLYKRHVDIESRIDITFGQIKFATLKSATEDIYTVIPKEIENNPKFSNSTVFKLYREVKVEMERILPSMPDTLETYLNYTVTCLLEAFSADYATLESERPRHLSTNPATSDRSAYRYLHSKMKLLKFSSLIIEKQFTDEEIEDFDLEN